MANENQTGEEAKQDQTTGCKSQRGIRNQQRNNVHELQHHDAQTLETVVVVVIKDEAKGDDHQDPPTIDQTPTWSPLTKSEHREDLEAANQRKTVQSVQAVHNGETQLHNQLLHQLHE
jgi:hypothetical protein